VALYPKFHEYFRASRPRFLAVWGSNDPFFLPPGPTRSSVTCPTPASGSCPPVISLWKPTSSRSRPRSASSWERNRCLPRKTAPSSVIGATALKPAPGILAVAAANAAANAAVDAIVASLAVELAPIRVNAIAPGTIDTGAYDAPGAERKAALFKARSATNPARRIGTAEDIAAAALTALTNGFLTGVSIPADGGEHLV